MHSISKRPKFLAVHPADDFVESIRREPLEKPCEAVERHRQRIQPAYLDVFQGMGGDGFRGEGALIDILFDQSGNGTTLGQVPPLLGRIVCQAGSESVHIFHIWVCPCGADPFMGLISWPPAPTNQCP